MSRAWTAAALLILLGTSSARAETVAIVGATVHTMGPAGTLREATVVIEDGRIRAVGPNVTVPAGARRIEAQGKVVTPGLFDSLSRLGLVEVSAVQGSADTGVEGDRFNAAFNVVDALNPRSSLIPVNRIEGLTRTLVAPEPEGSLIAGQGAVIHLGAGELVLRSPSVMVAVLGEGGAERAGESRGAAILRLREALQDARDYAENRNDFDRGERRGYALSRLDLEALGPVVRGELPLLLIAHRASDLQAGLRLMKEFKLDLILAGASEGWVVAREIAAAKVPVLVSTLSNLPERFEALGATLENAARMHAAGVTVAFMSSDAHNARNIRQAAGNAVAYGMPWEAAMASLTTVPARIWGVSDRYGTLEAGKDADVVIWDGDPLEVTTFADQVFIRGVEIPMESRQTLLRDRYKDLSGELPPAYRN